MKCEYCGRALKPSEWQCPGCGAAVEVNREEKKEDKTQEEQKNRKKEQSMGGVNGPNYNKYYEQYETPDRGRPLHISAYGSFGARMIAAIIDYVVLGLLFSFLPDTSIVLTVVYFAYRIIGESSICNGATIGKKAMGLKVVDSNFETIGLSQSAGRTFSKILSWALICIGFIMILFSKRRQALHDRLTGTYVIKVRA
ncbi:MAG: RDD family protein [Cellulosilyticum sp.]|nr:RDD family protein [Cellulosilyticum sp.]MEE1073117.1 RDD family protein [Cellulosilyticum sp.]